VTLAHRLVYVVDDDLSMRKAVGRLLESEGYAFEMFTGAREFLARVPQSELESSKSLEYLVPGPF
jgi:FixJ family two-component response regulator